VIPIAPANPDHPADMALPAPLLAPSNRLTLEDGATTTIHVARHERERTRLRVVVIPGQARLAPYCAARGITEAIVGGFFARPHGTPLGEVRTSGVARDHVPFTAPFDATRATLHVAGGRARIAPRNEIAPAPRGDLLQAGPLLVRDGRPIFDRQDDREGFSEANGQFDSDITDGRYPRAALGVSDTHFYAVAADGRGRHDAGLTLEELAAYMASLGCHTAMNLDGGGSTTLISEGRLCNRPRKNYEEPEPGGRPVSTALVFEIAKRSDRPKQRRSR
jgi:Phosphodiester glycosidase